MLEDINELKFYKVSNGINLTWNWPDGCNSVILLKSTSDFPDKPGMEIDGEYTNWYYNNQLIHEIYKPYYVKKGSYYNLQIDYETRDWYIKIFNVSKNEFSPGTSEQCKCVIPAGPLRFVYYDITLKRNKINLQIKIDPKDDQGFKFKLIGNTNEVTTESSGIDLLTINNPDHEWPYPDKYNIFTFAPKSIPAAISGKNFYARLFIDNSEPQKHSLRLCHNKSIHFPVRKKQLFKKNAVFSNKVSFHNSQETVREILCPYCFSKFYWWDAKYRKKNTGNYFNNQINDEEQNEFSGNSNGLKRINPYRRLLAQLNLYDSSKLNSVIKLCPNHKDKDGLELFNELFNYPLLHIGLLGAQESSKTTWVFSSIEKLISFGCTPLDTSTKDKLDNIRKMIYTLKSTIDSDSAPTDLVKPFLLDMNWDNGHRRRVFSFCDIDGETWMDFNKIKNSKPHMRYITTAQAHIFVIDPLRIDSIKGILESNQDIQGDAPKNTIDQRIILKNLTSALNEDGTKPKFKKPIAVVLSKVDELIRIEPTLRNELWQKPLYHPISIKDIGYDLSLHNKVQLITRDILERYDAGLVAEIEKNFENYAYFCISPAGCHAKNHIFAGEINPFRVEEPLLWIFYQLGLIPAIEIS